MEVNQSVKQFLQKAIRENRITQAYLFLGEEGLGKKEAALWYEQQLNPQDKNFHSNLLMIERQEGKREIEFEQIKEIKRWLKFSSPQGYRVVIINPAEAMNFIAQNALLKTLEEPNPQAVLILVANRLRGLTETILSRCQILRFKKANPEEISYWLKKEKGLSLSQIEELLFLSRGRIKKIQFWLEHPQALAEERKFFHQVQTLMNSNLLQQLAWMEKKNKDVNLEKILNTALYFYHYLVLQKAKGREGKLSFLVPVRYSWLDLKHKLQKLEEVHHLLETTNVNKKLAFNYLFINL